MISSLNKVYQYVNFMLIRQFIFQRKMSELQANVDPWLNNFSFHVYAQKSLFLGENDNGFFFTSASPSPVSGPIIELVPS